MPGSGAGGRGGWGAWLSFRRWEGLTQVSVEARPCGHGVEGVWIPVHIMPSPLPPGRLTRSRCLPSPLKTHIPDPSEAPPPPTSIRTGAGPGDPAGWQGAEEEAPTRVFTSRGPSPAAGKGKAGGPG